jgi:N-acetylated-alpha-linked acidic dipeptidase
MRHHLSAVLVAVTALAFTPRSADDGLLGFTAQSSDRQRALEARFDTFLSADSLRTWVEHLSSAPNHVGAPHTKENAEWMARQFRSWGYDVEIETFHVLLPTPTVRVVELVEPVTFSAKLAEPTLEEDETSRIVAGRLPPYNAYSADGDVTAELVYVNYGIPADYEELERRGISVEGKIVIARYGASWRGIKPKVAAEHGAIGCILYSDPFNDGYRQGDVYPEGAWRMAEGAQRGSVVDMPTYPGDPLTPFVGATRDAERLSVAEAPTIMKIPVLPISYTDAQPLLEALGGPVAPEGWRGALPLTYHIGPGPAKVHVKLAFDWSLRPAYNVIAKLEGSEYPDQWVIRGNHHDAWVFGAADPMSGMVALLDEARAVGALATTGWRPKRTIVYAAWDAEEPGLLGSTEWAEHHAAELKEKAVVYLNTDSNFRGFLNVGGSHVLERFVNQVANDVNDPQTDVSVAERLRARRRVTGDHAAETEEDLRIYALGSGSDYSAFLQYLTIPSLMVSYGGEGGGGSYHSIFDSFDHYTRFGDPAFAYGVTLAKTAGRMTLRLANAEVLPFRFANLASTLERYLEEVVELADSMRKDTEQRNARIADGAYTLAADPTKAYVPPTPRAAVPYLNFAPLENALARLENVAERYDTALEHRMDGGALSASDAGRLNRLLIGAERALGDETGLPRRPWFRHTIYAPGFYTGYGVKTLPGVREGIEQREWTEVDEQMERVAAAVQRLAGILEEVTRLVEGS